MVNKILLSLKFHRRVNSETTKNYNGEQQLNSNSQAVQETNNPSLQNNTLAGQLNYTPTDYSVSNSYSPVEDASKSPSNTITEMDYFYIGTYYIKTKA
jgi:hypothetical protein